MTLILEIPPQTETRLRSIANARGETLEAFTVSQLEKVATENSATGAAEVSPMARALAVKPVSSSGPVDAVADIEELRATRAEELSGPAKTETREQRRARIHAAIDAAQADFAHINRVFGDPVSALMACKRADEDRAEQRGL